MSKRILLLAATTGYQTRVFEEAARRLGYDVVMATDRCHVLEDPWGDQARAVRFHEPELAAEDLSLLQPPPDGIVAVGDRPTEAAALTAKRIGLRFHPPSAVATCRNKFLARECFREAGLNVPEYFRVATNVDLGEVLRLPQYPCVLKPLGLSASRGVIRADNEAEFAEAFGRICALLDSPEIRQLQDEQDRFIQVETYIPGREFALEGLMIDGALKTLAIFDKPDPLEGPFFEETIYVTPSREPAPIQAALIEATQRAATALGLTDGPLHAEMRSNDSGVFMLEVAARPIGGLCATALRFEGGIPLEELILRHAAGEDVRGIEREQRASGVMMIPIPRNGVYNGVEGVEAAQAVAGIDDVIITAKEGQRLQKLPEGATYLGFIFARGNSPADVETALRLSHQRLDFKIAAELAFVRP